MPAAALRPPPPLAPHANPSSFARSSCTTLQRIPRYALLLENLLKAILIEAPAGTDPKVAFPQLRTALNLVKEVASHVNEELRSSENRRRILQIEAELGNHQLVASNRFFIRKGDLHKRGGIRRFYLFSDLILYAASRGWSFRSGLS